MSIKNSRSIADRSIRRHPSALKFSPGSSWILQSLVLLYPLLLLGISLPCIHAFVQPNGLCLIPPHFSHHRPTLSHPLTHGVPSLPHRNRFPTRFTHQYSRMNTLSLALLFQNKKNEDYGAIAATAENGSIDYPDIDGNDKDPKHDQDESISKDIFALAIPGK